MNNNYPIILFDGVCKLCNHSINFIKKSDRKKRFRYVPLQSDEGHQLLERVRPDNQYDSVLLLHNNKIFTESDAALEICRLLSSPWKWLIIFKNFPKKWRNRIYHYLAYNRYKWFGKCEPCSRSYS